MSRNAWILSPLLVLGAALNAHAQTGNYPYVVKTIAGTFPLGDGGPATSALLYFPAAAVSDAGGNVYILDASNARIRKVTPGGTISSVASVDPFATDMKLGADGNFYVASLALVYKVSPTGTQTPVAGTGTYGFSGDGGPATGAQIGAITGLAFDAAGNLYLVDGSRIREVTQDGKIRTIAGTATSGFSGDGGPATAAQLSFPCGGVAVDSTNNVYIADSYNGVIRKISPDGLISTIAGNGDFGQPVDGPTKTPLGTPVGLAVDASNNLYFTDVSFDVVFKITPDGSQLRVAGNFNAFGSYSDGSALTGSLENPVNVSADHSGNLFVTDNGTHRVRKVTADGHLITIAGEIHYAGDGGLATAALLNEPQDVVVDPQGDVLIADSSNYRIRKVSPNGTINTYAGTGAPGNAADGTTVFGGASVNYIFAMASDAQGSLYLPDGSGRVRKISSNGVFSTVAGNGFFGTTGDGGPAANATFESLSGVAVDSSGNVYIADAVANRVRKVSAADGTISAFAGTGVSGFAGDGGLATGAQLNQVGALAVDQKGNIYLGDAGNNRIRMVAPNGVISTVAGNGILGRPNDGQPAKSNPFSQATAMTVDSAGNLYITSLPYGDIYRLSSGIIQRIGGGGNVVTDDPSIATTVSVFGYGIKADNNNDLYVADAGSNRVRKLILNSPSGFTASDGDGQTAQTGQSLAKAIKVVVNGRAGIGVGALTVNFAVTSGLATLSSASTQTDGSGTAGVSVTLGPVPGTVVITATLAGVSLPGVTFTETATAPTGGGGTVPTILTDGTGVINGATYQPGNVVSGSWVAVKGTGFTDQTMDWSNSDFSNGLPTILNGVQVLFNGQPGAMWYLINGSPQQINVQAPANLSGNISVQVIRNGIPGNTVTATAVQVAPGIFSYSLDGGTTFYPSAVFADRTRLGDPAVFPGARKATAGDHVVLFANSLAPSPAGVVSVSGTTHPVTVTIGPVTFPADFSGLVGPGEFQINLTTPNLPATGNYPITIQIDGQSSQPAVLFPYTN